MSPFVCKFDLLLSAFVERAFDPRRPGNGAEQEAGGNALGRGDAERFLALGGLLRGHRRTDAREVIPVFGGYAHGCDCRAAISHVQPGGPLGLSPSA